MVLMRVITISNGDDADADSERGCDGGELVVTISNGDDVDADSKRGCEGGDHFQNWRLCRQRPRAR